MDDVVYGVVVKSNGVYNDIDKGKYADDGIGFHDAIGCVSLRLASLRNQRGTYFSRSSWLSKYVVLVNVGSPTVTSERVSRPGVVMPSANIAPKYARMHSTPNGAAWILR